ncbi:MAG: hypothetical protein A3D92_25020 [Bacteroidetes bacterium RIFCSPHIGHO2_02_FULL_44_7]|nr:MAG: hypothetical protein A3D92_25020 [Bacteroidetes bacterium RIFCSPHIGHO2_02_FULL_44_7]
MHLVIPQSLILVFLFFGIAGCGGMNTNSPPKIRYGKDVCDQCRMIISEKQFAAASVDRDGSVTKFDGVGCLALYRLKHPSETERTWVQDYRTEEWVEFEKAFFVNAEKVMTPMGFGLVAFSNENVASEFAHHEGGVIVRVSNLPDIVKKKIGHV